MSMTLIHDRPAVGQHHSRAWAVARAILLVLLGLALSGAILAAQAPTSTSSGPRPDSLTNESLLNLLARSNRAMIAGARQAEATVQNSEVKRFAGQMAAEHSTILSNLKQLRQQLGYTAPDSTPAPAAAEQSITGDDTAAARPAPSVASDWSYVAQEIAGHTNLLLELQRRTARVGDERLRAFAANVMQTEETHLRTARELLSRQPKPEIPPSGR
jgi:predicted outer membrane protein